MTGSRGMCEVLVVEDDADLREMMCLLLGAEGFDPQPANDGHDALKMLRSRQVEPHVIVLDLMMPRLDGEAFIREMACDPSIGGIPVVVLTAVPAEQVHVPTAAALLPKPCDFAALLETLWRLCDRPVGDGR